MLATGGGGQAGGAGQQQPAPAILKDRFMEQLWPFQREGITFGLSKNGKCLIADEMGLGKTVQAIGIMAHYYHEFPLLIVVPSSVKWTWADELGRWTKIPPEQIKLIKSRSDVEGLHGAKVVIMTYGLLVNKSPVAMALQHINFKAVILDESHSIKDKKSQRCRLLQNTLDGAKRIVMLSGTPALGRPIELWAQVSALQYHLFGDYWSYARRYCDAHQGPWGWDVKGCSNMPELQGLLAQVMIRRRKQEVLPQLPPKIRQRVSVEVSAKNLKELNQMMEGITQQAKRLDAAAVSGDGERAHGAMFQFQRAIMEAYQKSGMYKIEGVKSYLTELLTDASSPLEPTEKIIIFAVHKGVMDALDEFLTSKNIDHIRIDGSVSAKDRHERVQLFQDPHNTYRVALLSMLAAGQGITLTTAKMVCFAELHWTPGVMEQAEDRAHRIGQTDNVLVAYLMPLGNTPDQLVWNIMKKKDRLLADLFDNDMYDGSALAHMEQAFGGADAGAVLEPADEVLPATGGAAVVTPIKGQIKAEGGGGRPNVVTPGSQTVKQEREGGGRSGLKREDIKPTALFVTPDRKATAGEGPKRVKKEEKSSGGGGGGVSQVEVKRAEGKRRATKLILDDDDDDDDEDNEATQPPADRYGRGGDYDDDDDDSDDEWTGGGRGKGKRRRVKHG